MKKNLLLTILFVAVVGVAGCGRNASANKKETLPGTMDYSTSVSMGTEDYSTYINTQSMTIINQLTTRMDSGLNVAKDSYPIQDELKNTETSLEIINDAINNLTVTNPPAVYADTRENVLRTMANAKSSLEAYQTALQKNDKDEIKTAINLMKSDASSLTAYIGLDYQ